mmetsp:Transcript_15510/g.43415  ORF Transcript_15510/g.43415 Transcript_15510/m.43415 type:complete len:218 (+) Transcript_15510:4-657(+)
MLTPYLYEVVVAVALTLVVVYWWRENPEAFIQGRRRPMLQRQVSHVRRKCVIFTSYLRIWLDDLGFFSGFGLLTVFAMAAELYLISKSQGYYSSIIWLTLVGYVGANHFLYGLHSWAGTCGAFSEADTQLIKDLAGVGGMLKEEETHSSWHKFIWDFSKHRCPPFPFCLSFSAHLAFWGAPPPPSQHTTRKRMLGSMAGCPSTISTPNNVHCASSLF